jgi:hypothetical protein
MTDLLKESVIFILQYIFIEEDPRSQESESMAITCEMLKTLFITTFVVLDELYLLPAKTVSVQVKKSQICKP